MKYKSQTGIIEAIQSTGLNWMDCTQFTCDEHLWFWLEDQKRESLEILTLEQPFAVYVGDYIVKDEYGNFHRCEPDNSA